MSESWIQPGEKVLKNKPVDWLNSKKCEKRGFWGTVRMNSGQLQVARGGSRAKAPPLAACPRDVQDEKPKLFWFLNEGQYGAAVCKLGAKSWCSAL